LNDPALHPRELGSAPGGLRQGPSPGLRSEAASTGRCVTRGTGGAVVRAGRRVTKGSGRADVSGALQRRGARRGRWPEHTSDVRYARPVPPPVGTGPETAWNVSGEPV